MEEIDQYFDDLKAVGFYTNDNYIELEDIENPIHSTPNEA